MNDKTAAPRDALLLAAKKLFVDHQQTEPHHQDVCDLCLEAVKAIAGAEPKRLI